MTFTVLPGYTALQALIEAGVAVELGCQTGGCGMCVTAYVKGDIIHKVGCLCVADRERYFCSSRVARKDAHCPRPINSHRLSTKFPG